MVIKISTVDLWLNETLTILEERIKRSSQSNSNLFKGANRNIAFSQQHIAIVQKLVDDLKLQQAKSTKNHGCMSNILIEAALNSQTHYDKANSSRSRFKKRLGASTNSLIQDLNTAYQTFFLSLSKTDSLTGFKSPKETKKEEPEDGYDSSEDLENESLSSNQHGLFLKSSWASKEIANIKEFDYFNQLEAMQLASALEDSLDPSNAVQIEVNIIEPAVIIPPDEKVSPSQKFTAFMDRVIDILDDYLDEPLETRKRHMKTFLKMLTNERTVSFHASIAKPGNVSFTPIIATLLVEKKLFEPEDFSELLDYLKAPETQNLFRKTLELDVLPDAGLKYLEKQKLLHIASQLKPWFSKGLAGDQHQNIWKLIGKMENIATSHSREMLDVDDLALFTRALNAVLSELKSQEIEQNVTDLLNSFLNLEQISVLIRTNKHALNIILLQLPDITFDSDRPLYRILQQWLKSSFDVQTLTDLILKSDIAWSGLLQLARILPEQKDVIRKALAVKYDDHRTLKPYYASFGVNNFETLLDFFQPNENKSSADVAFISTYPQQLTCRKDDKAKPRQGYGLLGYLKFINRTISTGLKFYLTYEQKKQFIETTIKLFSPLLMNSLLKDMSIGIGNIIQDYRNHFDYAIYFEYVIVPFVQNNGLNLTLEKYIEFSRQIPGDSPYPNKLFAAFVDTFSNPTRDEFNQLQEHAPDDNSRERLAEKFLELASTTRYGL